MCSWSRKTVVWLCVGIFLVLLAFLWSYRFVTATNNDPAVVVQQKPTIAIEGKTSIGGPFSLYGVDGKAVKSTDFPGYFLLIYFGYTYCPDVCPAALENISAALKQLGQQGKQIKPFFITLDTNRDTPEQMKNYMTNFSPAIKALHGSQEQVNAVAKMFRAFSRKVKEDGSPFAPGEDPGQDYLVDHSSIIYLMNPQGAFVAHFNHLTPPDELAAGIGGVLTQRTKTSNLNG